MPPRIETVASFAKGLAVLRSFGAGARRQTITDVAARTGLTRAGARRFLHTLVEIGYARSDGKHFELTARVLELGDAYVAGIGALEAVLDVLPDLARDLGETVSAATLDGSDVVCIARAPADFRAASVGLAVAGRRPAHGTAAGMALLARLSPKDLDRLLRAAEARAPAVRTPALRETLRARLAEVRERGYAVSEGGEESTHAIAVAVADRAASDRLAVEVSIGGESGDAAARIAEILPALRRAAERIAAAST